MDVMTRLALYCGWITSLGSLNQSRDMTLWIVTYWGQRRAPSPSPSLAARRHPHYTCAARRPPRFTTLTSKES